MQVTDRLKLLDEMHNYERALLEKKAHDYTGGGKRPNNLLACEALGICTAESGILVRMADKFQRLITLLSGEVKVNDETLQDTVSDLRNYLALLVSIKQDKEATHESGRKLGLEGRASTSS